MKLAIVAGGPESLLPDLNDSEYEDFEWIGADHGTVVLLKNKIRPIRAFGDFDSLTPEERIEIDKNALDLCAYPPEKDKTDLELALNWALRLNPEQCYLFGVTGGRMDHALASVQLLMKSTDTTTELAIIDKKNWITLLTPGAYPVKNNPSYRYLSFLALTERVTGLSLSCVKYPLRDAELHLGSSLCISNEPQAAIFHVSFSHGLLLMMRCSD
ncbi:thiamine diphosphokinase [Sporolactobacillus shoreicorticis]|uniref:Thiamine diphosphokinase n=1 Tax=Sporolactobacillus shoreicorticis TaxID=1923877 RepID=A0ABW5S2L8_9BACL|nr:thiamine diphosphokinase [Sporolactobacillus shoreicorticis]MCO7127977.1 thiamine diphosphokinase [Sporolactobacillus shoreicorticis]